MLRNILGWLGVVAGAYAIGFGVVLAVSALLSGCGGPAALQCKLDAVKFLPDDPMQVTPYDVVDLVGRLHACKQAGSDAGR